jgi:biopolymer transport protein ExbB/TolQ
LEAALSVEEVIFEVAEALRYPVLILALAALVWVLFELGSLVAEFFRRRRRRLDGLEQAVHDSRVALGKGDTTAARVALYRVAWNKSMRNTLGSIIELRGAKNASDKISKRLAEFDYRCMRRLERTRVLVRFGPALGLMGTLIPLSPALVGLASGDVETLADNLRVAFSVTVLGLLIGAIAFTISLIRDRLYGQDYSDVEYAANEILEGGPLAPSAATPSSAASGATTPAPAGGPAAPSPASSPGGAPAPAPGGGSSPGPATAPSAIASPTSPPPRSGGNPPGGSPASPPSSGGSPGTSGGPTGGSASAEDEKGTPAVPGGPSSPTSTPPTTESPKAQGEGSAQ